MTEKAVSIQDMSRIHLIFGDFDNNINIIQKEYKVSIFTRDDEIRIKGDENAVDNAEQVIKTLISTVEKGEMLLKMMMKRICVFNDVLCPFHL